MVENTGKRLITLMFIISAALILTSSVTAASMDELTLKVYEDGVVVVEDRVSPGIDSSNVTVKLLANDVENVLVVGSNGKLVNYEIKGDQLTIYGDLPSQVIIHYETADLTFKNGSLWILEVYLFKDAVVLLPSNSVIISLNDIPKMIAGEKDSLKLVLTPGLWRIEYVLQFTPRSSMREGGQNSFYIIIISSLVGGSIALFSAILYVRRKRNSSILLDDERRIFELVKKRGRISEAEIRTLTHLPKTTVWRIVRRLERKGLVKVVQVNKRNEVELA